MSESIPRDVRAQARLEHPPAPRRRLMAWRGDGWRAIPFLIPAAAFLLVFVYIPAAVSLGLGFFHYRLLGVDTTFAGVYNFKSALTYNVFWIAFHNTLYFAVLMIPTTLVGAVVIALLLHKNVRLFSFVRTAVLLPYITPVIATSIGWLWMFDPQYGIMNAALAIFHLPPSQWMLSPTMAMPSVALYSLWHGIGFDVVIVLSALGGIPPSVMEAAAIDGATEWRKFWKVTMPLLSPVLFFLTIVTTLATLQAFSQVYALSGGQGGPEYATTTLLLLVYQTAFRFFHFSYAAAMAILLVLMILILTLIQGALSRRWVFYQ
jgi:multiple sugar transport system permease protein